MADMENKRFNPDFIEGVNKADIPFLRNYIVSTIIFDPVFTKNKCDDCMAYIKERGLDITEEFKLNATEAPTPTDPSEWNKLLFYGKIEDLRLNFAYDKRVGELKKISRILYADKINEVNAAPFKEAPTGRRSSAKKPSPLMIFGAIATIAAVITAIVLLCRK